MTAVFYDIYLFSISTLFKILEWATSSYVGSVLKKICQKFAMVDKGLIFFAKVFITTANLSSGSLRVRTVCPSHTPHTKNTYVPNPTTLPPPPNATLNNRGFECLTLNRGSRVYPNIGAAVCSTLTSGG